MILSIRKIILIILFSLVAVVVIYYFWGHMPGVLVDILYPKKLELVRYYACAWAMCTKGCSEGMLTDHNNPDGYICLKNDTDTPGCDMPCENLCDGELGKLCGPNNYITLDLEAAGSLTGVPLKGITEVTAIPGEGVFYCGVGSEIKGLIEYMRGKNYPNFPEAEKLNCGRKLFGGIYDLSSDWKGAGAIFLDQEVGRTGYGCFKQSPYRDIFIGAISRGTVSSTFCGGDYGYYQCKFDGNLYIWAHATDDGNCADVRINSTVPEPGIYWVEVEPIEITTALNRPESYDIRIFNELDTGNTFYIQKKDDFNVCTLSDNSVWINDLDKKTVRMGCEADEESEVRIHLIDLTIRPDDPLQLPTLIQVRFIVANIEVEVTPEDPDLPDNPKQAVVKQGDEARYNVKVTNRFPTDETFTLTVTKPGNVNCSLVNSITIPAGGSEDEWMSCWSDDAGTYGITVAATHEELGIDDSDTVTLMVTAKCKLKDGYDNLNLEISSPADPGQQLNFKVDGFEGCSGEIIDLTMLDEEFSIMQCAVPTSGDVCEDDDWNLWPNIEANNLGDYKFYVSMDTDDGLKTGEATLTINIPGIDDRSCDECNSQRCSYSGSTICDRWVCDVWWPWGSCMLSHWEDCTNSCDPQSCQEDELGTCAAASNLCCVSGEDYYSPGPSDVPCLSPDANTHNDKTENITWREVDDAKNILVYNQPAANFHISTCSGDDDCTGGSGAPDVLSGASCNSNDRCEIVPGRDYLSWEFVNISLDSRPVYGIKVVIVGIVTVPMLTRGSYFDIYLHEKDGNWFFAGEANFWAPGGWDGLDGSVSNILPPSGWSWDNIDAMLIALDDAYIAMPGGDLPDPTGDIGYVGLLTKDPANTTFCTDGDGDYNRIVDDGKTCYWGTDCPPDEDGWTGTKSFELGPIKGLDFDCTKTGTCGKGYFEFCRSGGVWGWDKCDGSQDKKICFYDVTCKTGGWRGEHKVCSDPLADCRPPAGC